MKKVVYIDDERDLLDLFPMYFEECGHEVICFDNHKEASKYISSNKIDCLFIDYLMPCGSPHDFLSLIGSDHNFTKFILSGSYYLSDNHLEVFNAVLTKPFILDDYDIEGLIEGKVVKIA